MSIHARCPTCGHIGNAPDSFSGKIATCPKCKHKMQLPELPPTAIRVAVPIHQNLPSRQRTSHPLKSCPFCFGEVNSDALKCRHCGENLDPELRAAEEARNTAVLAAHSTDVFGVLGVILGALTIIAGSLSCCTLGISALVAIPVGVTGFVLSFLGRSNRRVSGITLNGIGLIVALTLGSLTFYAQVKSEFGGSWPLSRKATPNCECPACGARFHADTQGLTMHQKWIVKRTCPVCGLSCEIAVLESLAQNTPAVDPNQLPKLPP